MASSPLSLVVACSVSSADYGNRGGYGAPQPVYKISLNNAETSPMVTVPALIDRIIIGPTRDPIAMKEAFEVLLDKAGVGDAGKRVFVSNIPLSQLAGRICTFSPRLVYLEE